MTVFEKHRYMITEFVKGGIHCIVHKCLAICWYTCLAILHWFAMPLASCISYVTRTITFFNIFFSRCSSFTKILFVLFFSAAVLIYLKKNQMYPFVEKAEDEEETKKLDSAEKGSLTQFAWAINSKPTQLIYTRHLHMTSFWENYEPINQPTKLSISIDQFADQSIDFSNFFPQVRRQTNNKRRRRNNNNNNNRTTKRKNLPKSKMWS